MLSRLIEDLRTLALADAGALRLERESTDAVALVRDAVRAFEPEAARHGVALTVAPAAIARGRRGDRPRPGAHPAGAGQPARERPAPHAGGAGGYRVPRSRRPGGVAVAVADAGEGIAAEDVPQIFDRFYKGQASRGSGLGLTIAKRLVVAHGGEIRADSRRGQGTTVTFSIPAQDRIA